MIPGHLLLPVVERLGLPVVEALQQPWLEVRSEPLAGARTLRRVAAGLNNIGDPHLAKVATEVYVHSDASSGIRHTLARGPHGPAMTECLLADNSLSPLHLRPLLATGDPQVARRLLRLPARSVT